VLRYEKEMFHLAWSSNVTVFVPFAQKDAPGGTLKLIWCKSRSWAQQQEKQFQCNEFAFVL